MEGNTSEHADWRDAELTKKTATARNTRVAKWASARPTRHSAEKYPSS